MTDHYPETVELQHSQTSANGEQALFIYLHWRGLFASASVRLWVFIKIVASSGVELWMTVSK